jgi:hypothetical protein
VLGINAESTGVVATAAVIAVLVVGSFALAAPS